MCPLRKLIMCSWSEFREQLLICEPARHLEALFLTRGRTKSVFVVFLVRPHVRRRDRQADANVIGCDVEYRGGAQCRGVPRVRVGCPTRKADLDLCSIADRAGCCASISVNVSTLACLVWCQTLCDQSLADQIAGQTEANWDRYPKEPNHQPSCENLRAHGT